MAYQGNQGSIQRISDQFCLQPSNSQAQIVFSSSEEEALHTKLSICQRMVRMKYVRENWKQLSALINKFHDMSNDIEKINKSVADEQNKLHNKRLEEEKLKEDLEVEHSKMMKKAKETQHGLSEKIELQQQYLLACNEHQKESKKILDDVILTRNTQKKEREQQIVTMIEEIDKLIAAHNRELKKLEKKLANS